MRRAEWHGIGICRKIVSVLRSIFWAPLVVVCAAPLAV
jgi:hypothetical protein